MKKRIKTLPSYAFARTVFVLFITITAIYTVSINYEPLLNLHAQEDSLEYGDSTDNPPNEVPDASGLFNERGYYKSNSVSYDENEIISDFNGNLMYSFPMFNIKGPGDMHLDLSLNYNGSVNYQIVAANVNQASQQTPLPIYNITAPGWVFNVNGMGVQMFDFETNFFTHPGGSDIVEDDAVHLLATGYHITDRLRLSNTINNDAFVIMMGDGSAVTLERIMPSGSNCGTDGTNCYVGDYYSTGKKSYISAKVEYIDTVGAPEYRNRRAYVMKGDGLTYIYEEQKIEYLDFPLNTGNLYLRPQVFLLKKIKDRFGHGLSLIYGSNKGRPILNRISPISVPVDGPWAGTTTFLYSQMPGGVAVYNSIKGKYKIMCDNFTLEDAGGHHLTSVNEIINPYEDKIKIGYDHYSRYANNVRNSFFPNGSMDVRFTASGNSSGLMRIDSVTNYNGGVRKYTYLGEELGINMSPDPIPGYFARSEIYYGQGRDAFFANMLESKQTKNVGNEEIKTESFVYNFNSGRLYQYSEPVSDSDFYSTKRDIVAYSSSLNNNTPTSQGTLKYYKNFRLKPALTFGTSPDWSGETKITKEIFYVSDTTAPYRSISYAFDKGTISGGGFTGSFLDTAITEQVKGQTKKQTFAFSYSSGPSDRTYDNPITQKVEFDPLRTKTITDFIIFDEKIKFYQGGHYFPSPGTNTIDSSYFYTINLASAINIYDSTNSLLRKITNEYLDTLSSQGYIGQLVNTKTYAQGSTSVYHETHNKYYRNDTLGLYLYGSYSNMPSCEGLLKATIGPNGDSTKFYYHPVKISAKDPVVFGYPLDVPKISYKKVFEDGHIETLSEIWQDTKLPVRIDNYSSSGNYTSKYMMYNTVGDVTRSIDDNNFITQFVYDNLDRITRVTMPHDFDTLALSDSTTYDTTYVPVSYNVGSTLWGNLGINDTLNLYNVNDVANNFYANKSIEAGNTDAGPNDINRVAVMQMIDPSFPNMDTITHATLQFWPYGFYHSVNGTQTDTNYLFRIYPMDTLSFHGGEYKWHFGTGFQNFTGINSYTNVKSPSCPGYPGFRYNYPLGYNILDITQLMNGNRGKRFEGLAFEVFHSNLYGNTEPADTFLLRLSSCITSQEAEDEWKRKFSPVIHVEGVYKQITPRIIKRFGNSTLNYEYDDADNKVTVYSKIDKPSTENRYKKTEYTFDGFYRVWRTKLYNSLTNNSDTSSSFIEYNYLDQKAKTVDAAGHWTEFSYDTLGYLMQTRNVDSSLSYNALAYTNSLGSYFGGTYTGFIEKRKYTDETGREFYKYFDAVGNLLREEKFVAGDGLGNVQNEDNPYNPDTTFIGQSRPSLITLTTDYQYDLLYRLKKVKTPEGKTIEYLYDLYGRQSQRMTPDAGMTKYSYDVKGNLILSQDANQKAIIYNLFTGRTYDGLNRLLTISDVKLPGVHDPSGSGPGGSGDTTLPSEFDFPSSTDSLYVINAYDSLGLSPFASLFNSNKPYNFYTSAANNTKGMLTATAFRTNILDPWNFKFYRYDARGRVIKFWQKLAGMDSMKTMEYRYNGSNQAENLSYQPGRNDWKFFKFKYDDAGRLDKAGFWAFNGTVGIGSGSDSFSVPSEEQVDNNQGWTFTPYVDYSYNKNQQIDTLLLNAASSPLVFRHSYNNRNWLQGFYRPQSVGVFGYSLYYNPNGNIDRQNFAGSYRNSLGDQTDLIHTYTYDNSNRMVKADRTSYADSSHDIIMGYDKDGNIKKMKRFGSANNLADNFSYEYFSGTNKLKKVTGASDQYVYDANGNVIADSLKHNYFIKYDWRNLITELRRKQVVGDGSEGEGGIGDPIEEDGPVLMQVYRTNYWYDESGNRICKKNSIWVDRNGEPDPVEDVSEIPEDDAIGDGSGGYWAIQSTVYYIRDISGKEIAIYNGNSVDQWNLFGNDQVGDIKSNGNKFFYLKDHLGTVRVVLDSTNTIVAANDYDAWGYPLENRSYTSVNDPNQKYRFTSKERDHESSQDGVGYDYFGARYYDSRIANWTSIDPLFEKHIQWTPYNYVLRNPLSLIDPDGMQEMAVKLTYPNQAIRETWSEINAKIRDGIKTTKNWFDNNRALTTVGKALPYVGPALIIVEIMVSMPDPEIPIPQQATKNVVDATQITTLNSENNDPTLNEIQGMIQKDQAPESIKRLDKGNPDKNEKPHIHLKGDKNKNHALNKDGTWKHGGRDLTNKEKKFLEKIGWGLPK